MSFWILSVSERYNVRYLLPCASRNPVYDFILLRLGLMQPIAWVVHCDHELLNSLYQFKLVPYVTTMCAGHHLQKQSELLDILYSTS